MDDLDGLIGPRTAAAIAVFQIEDERDVRAALVDALVRISELEAQLADLQETDQ